MPGVLLWILPIPMAKATAAVTVDLSLTDTHTNQVIWRRTLKNEVSRTYLLYTAEGILYGPSTFSYSMPLPPADAGVDRRSIFAWHFEALRRAMKEAKPELAAALRGR